MSRDYAARTCNVILSVPAITFLTSSRLAKVVNLLNITEEKHVLL